LQDNKIPRRFGCNKALHQYECAASAVSLRDLHAAWRSPVVFVKMIHPGAGTEEGVKMFQLTALYRRLKKYTYRKKSKRGEKKLAFDSKPV
jgi:hypothetical protein